MEIGDQVAVVQGDARRHACLLEQPLLLIPILLSAPGSNDRVQFVMVCSPIGGGGKSRVISQIRTPDHLAECLLLLICP